MLRMFSSNAMFIGEEEIGVVRVGAAGADGGAKDVVEIGVVCVYPVVMGGAELGLALDPDSAIVFSEREDFLEKRRCREGRLVRVRFPNDEVEKALMLSELALPSGERKGGNERRVKDFRGERGV